MGAVTYPQEAVERELNSHFVPCKLESAKHGDLARKFNVRWLPGLVVCDAEERPANVQTSFLAPEDFLFELSYGRALVAMGEKRYDDAEALFREVGEKAPVERAPEAWYWMGISNYRRSKDFADCLKAWAKIVERWPGSQWARRVEYALPRA